MVVAALGHHVRSERVVGLNQRTHPPAIGMFLNLLHSLLRTTRKFRQDAKHIALLFDLLLIGVPYR